MTGLILSRQIRQLVNEDLKDRQVKEGQRVREDKIVINPVHLPLQLNKFIFYWKFFLLNVMIVSPYLEQQIKSISPRS